MTSSGPARRSPGAARVRVKICGLTSLDDALAAAELGADALGFNFWPGSKRFCPPERAAAIAARLPPFVSAVGVFVNQPRRHILKVAKQVGLHAVQLHGDEGPEDCRGFPLPVVKAIRVGSQKDLTGLEAFQVAAFLLDAPSPGFGGSGRTFDWRWARKARLERPQLPPFVVAGGLTPANVAQAIRATRPFAVDVASGVESAPGLKDARLMARFLAAASGAGARARVKRPHESRATRATRGQR